MRKNWAQYAALAIVVVLLVMTAVQGGRIEALEERLENQTGAMERMLQRELGSISGQVRRELAESVRLAVDYTLEPAGLDPAQRILLADLSVTLRQWAADTQAVLLVRAGDGTEEVPLIHEGNGVFAAPLSLNAEKRGELALDLSVTTGGVTAREDLGSWGDVSMLLPLRKSSWGGRAWRAYQSGVLTLLYDLKMALNDQSGESVPVKDPVYRVYRNGALVLERPASTDPNDVKNGWYAYYLVAAPGTGIPETEQVRVDCAPGDELVVAFACTDGYGLGYEFIHSRLTVTEQGPENAAPLASDDYPRLTWPE